MEKTGNIDPALTPVADSPARPVAADAADEERCKEAAALEGDLTGRLVRRACCRSDHPCRDR